MKNLELVVFSLLFAGNIFAELHGVSGGLVVQIGGDTTALSNHWKTDGYLFQYLETSDEQVSSLRKKIQALGLNGKVTALKFDGTTLPYIDNMVNLLVCPGSDVPCSEEELLRVLVPNGTALINGKKISKPWPKEIDEWTHYLHDAGNNAVAHDSVIGPPRRMQWQGSPRWGRHHDHMSSVNAVVTSAGRLFYIFDEGPRSSILLPSEWQLIARDAFNGTVLWKRPIENWHTQMWVLKSGPAFLPRRLVAAGDRVFATLGLPAPLTALDAATGETIRTYDTGGAVDEIIFENGTLFLVVSDRTADVEELYANSTKKPLVVKDVKTALPPVEAKRRIVAVDAESGNVLWSRQQTVMPLSLAADATRIYSHDGEKMVCLDRKTGKEVWASEPVIVRGTFSSKMPFTSEYAPTLVVYDDVVLFSGGETVEGNGVEGKDLMLAVDAKTGQTLWKGLHGACGYRSPEDVLVAGGLVWSGETYKGEMSGELTGRDLHTGEIKNQFVPNVDTHWFHHRCYRAKATDTYLLLSRTGIEFVDYANQDWEPHHWVRGACLYGIMPANGLIYAPPHPCACYPEAKQFGFSALAPAQQESGFRSQGSARLEKGPAYSQRSGFKSDISSAGWPTYRGDNQRSGYTPQPVSAALKPGWKTELGGRLSPAVSAEGKVFVSAIDADTVYALDADSGKVVWSYIAGGCVDSPPTLFDGTALFGCADGWVYCLRAADGELVWRFRAAPAERQLMAFEQIESVWPVPGNILVREGIANFVAGRSMFLDGGLRLIRLDAKTGALVTEKMMDDKDPLSGENLQTDVAGLNMPVALPDILSCDDKYMYMRSQPFDFEGNRTRIAHVPAEEQAGDDQHLFCPSGFTDDSWWHRSYWVYGRAFDGGAGGYHRAGRYAPSAKMMVFNDDWIYGYGRKQQYYRWTTPLDHQLFAFDKSTLQKEAPSRRPQPKKERTRSFSKFSNIGFEITEHLNPDGRPLAVEAWVKAADKNGVIVSCGGPLIGYALALVDGHPAFSVRPAKEKPGTVTADRDITGRKWVHLTGVLTKDRKLQLYINGKLEKESPATGFVNHTPNQPMVFGSSQGNQIGEWSTPSANFKCLLDEVRIFFGELTAEEISSHWDQAGAVKAKNAELALCCTFDDKNANDSSGNGTHGIVAANFREGRFGNAVSFQNAAKKKKSGSRNIPEIGVKHEWEKDIPLHARAMLLAADTLFIAGPPSIVEEEQAHELFALADTQTRLVRQAAMLQGSDGGIFRAVSTSGETLAEASLDSLPVFDGLCAANGKIYMVMIDGTVRCFE